MASDHLQRFIEENCPGARSGDPIITNLLLDKIETTKKLLQGKEKSKGAAQ